MVSLISNNINLNFKLAPIPTGTNEVVHGRAYPNPLQWYSTNVDLILNSNTINTSSSLQIAATLLHEGIHAEMFRYLLSVHGTSGLTDANFPTLYNFYKQYKTNESPQHQAMAAHYISVMGSALEAFDEGKFSFEHYKALAWDGLKETDAYTSLSPSEKQDIASKANDVLAGRQTSNCND